MGSIQPTRRNAMPNFKQLDALLNSAFEKGGGSPRPSAIKF